MPIKRALVCSPVMPAFDRESGSRRIFHLIVLLQEAGWSVTFFAENMTGGERYAHILRQRGVMVYGGRHSRGISAEYLPNPKVLFENGHFDLVLVAFWYVAERLLPMVRSCAPHTRFIVDSIDLHFLRHARKAFSRDHTLPKALELDYASEMIRELNVYAAVDGVFTVSQKEADLINDFVSDPNKAYAVPDMEELARSPLAFEARKGILFVGNFRHLPNVRAIKYLFGQIVPRIDPRLLQRHPLYVVGNALDEDIHQLGKGIPDVKMVGWVPSILPYFNKACVSIVPLTYGAGTKRKVIETLSVGTPCVSTSIGIEGLALRHGQEILVADDPEAFAAAIETLLDDELLWHRLAEQGRAHIVATHGSEVVRSRLHEALESVMAKKPGPRDPSMSLRWLSNEMAGHMHRAKLGIKHWLRTVRIRARLK